MKKWLMVFILLLGFLFGPPVLADEPDTVPLNKGDKAPFGCICIPDIAYTSCIKCKISLKSFREKEVAYKEEIEAHQEMNAALSDENESLVKEIQLTKDAKDKLDLLCSEQIAELSKRTFLEQHGLVTGLITGIVVTVGIAVGSVLAFR